MPATGEQEAQARTAMAEAERHLQAIEAAITASENDLLALLDQRGQAWTERLHRRADKARARALEAIAALEDAQRDRSAALALAGWTEHPHFVATPAIGRVNKLQEPHVFA